MVITRYKTETNPIFIQMQCFITDIKYYHQVSHKVGPTTPPGIDGARSVILFPRPCLVNMRNSPHERWEPKVEHQGFYIECISLKEEQNGEVNVL